LLFDVVVSEADGLLLLEPELGLLLELLLALGLLLESLLLLLALGLLELLLGLLELLLALGLLELLLALGLLELLLALGLLLEPGLELLLALGLELLLEALGEEDAEELELPPPDVELTPSAAMVCWSSVPLALMPCFFWNCLSAVVVLGPTWPSVGPALNPLSFRAC